MENPHTQFLVSPFSSQNTEPISYKGLFNLAMLMLVFSNIRLVLENFFRYGWLTSLDPWRHWLEFRLTSWIGVAITSTLVIHLVIAVLIEKLALSLKSSQTLSLPTLLHCVNLVTVLVSPCLLIKQLQPVLGSKIMVIIFTLTVFLKLYSYAHTNTVIRDQYFNEKKTDSRGKPHTEQKAAFDNDVASYPSSVTFKGMFMFFLFPTLCYQLSYPRTDHINFQRLAGKTALFVFLVAIVYIIGFQYVYPAIVNSVQYLDDPLMNTPKIIERLLKIAVPNLYLWLISFYAFFDLYLGILAEITYFGDSNFYGDWWNARTLGYYWNHWNRPVHSWMKRHVFIPLLNRGYSKLTAVFISFLISALGHEFIFAVPFGLKGWAFGGILFQVPLIYWTEILKQYHYVGNVIFWMSIALGQPFMTVMYYRDYLARTGLPPSIH